MASDFSAIHQATKFQEEEVCGLVGRQFHQQLVCVVAFAVAFAAVPGEVWVRQQEQKVREGRLDQPGPCLADPS